MTILLTRKNWALILVLLFYCNFSAFKAYAQDLTPIPTDQEMENILKTQEALLRKIELGHQLKERVVHKQNTQQVYQKAIVLYKQQRLEPAKVEFNKVEDAMADYKMTNTYLRLVDNKSIQELKTKMHRIREINRTQLAISLADNASVVYKEASYLGNDKSSVVVKKKLARLIGTFRQLSEQVFVQKQLDKIAQEANSYDQEIFKLTQAKNYLAAKKKYAEFQQAMIDDLARVKESTAQLKNGYMSEEKFIPTPAVENRRTPYIAD